MSTRHLGKLLNPASIAVVGASARPESPGFVLCRNIIEGGYVGKLHLVNPRYKEVLGQTCHRSLKQLPETPDLVLVLTPMRVLRRTLVQCAKLGVKIVIVMSGSDAPKALHRYAARLGLRILGPWCAGLIRPHLKLYATFATNSIANGKLAVVSQSASLGAALLDWAESSGVGFSALLSTGGDTDIRLADILDLLANDRYTRAIIVYLDRIRDSRSLLSALSAAARLKPVVLMKSTQEGARYCDALTRNGITCSSDLVLQAALKRAGVVRIRTFSNLFSSTKILASGMRTQGKRLGVISNGAAPAMLACEHIEIKGFRSPLLDAAQFEALRKALGSSRPAVFNGSNPIVLRDPKNLAEHLRTTIAVMADCGAFDALLIIHVPDSRNDPDTIAAVVKDCLPTKIPLLSCWMGESSVATARELLADAGVASFRTPGAATDGFDFLYRYFVSQQQLLQLPNPASRFTSADVDAARELISRSLADDERVLGPQRTRELMSLFDIAVLPAQRATSAEDAVSAARQIGYPVVMKLVSPNISYKAAVVRTRIGLDSDEAVRAAWLHAVTRLHERRPDAEWRGVLIEAMHAPENQRQFAIGLTRDAVFGPVLSIGIGGDNTSLIQRRVVQLPPLNNYLIDELLDSRELATYLGEFRHNAAMDRTPLVHVLRQLSELSCELPEVFSLDINPLVLSDEGAVAMDIQVVLERAPDRQRYTHLAIHPYPWHWRREQSLKGGLKVLLRPIRPEDGEALQQMISNMSPEARYMRFMHAVNELSPRTLAQFTKLDYDRQMAFVAEADTGEVVGASRYTIDNARETAEFGIALRDSWQGCGLGRALMLLLIEHAASQGLDTLQGDVLRGNTPMQRLMRSLGFSSHRDIDEPEILIHRYALQDHQSPGS